MSSLPSGSLKKVRVLLSDAQNSRLKQAARRSGVTASAFIRVALERELALEEQLAQQCGRQAIPDRRESDSSPAALQPLLF